jgi:hypothetical protein
MWNLRFCAQEVGCQSQEAYTLRQQATRCMGQSGQPRRSSVPAQQPGMACSLLTSVDASTSRYKTLAPSQLCNNPELSHHTKFCLANQIPFVTPTRKGVNPSLTFVDTHAYHLVQSYLLTVLETMSRASADPQPYSATDFDLISVSE